MTRKWLFNDLSAQGSIADGEAALRLFEPLLQLREENRVAKQLILCSRSLHAIELLNTTNLLTGVLANNSPLKTLLLSWLTKYGPFWDDERVNNEEDYFECLGSDVTDQGLGEAARREILEQMTSCYSFEGVNGVFATSPLEVVHGLPDEPEAILPIENFWDIEALRSEIQGCQPLPSNWGEAVSRARDDYPSLRISTQVERQISAEPFSQNVVERMNVLLGILQEFVSSRDNGLNTVRTNELVAQHFSGGKALFSDESLSNKTKFRNELSFLDPDNQGEKEFCPYHGKIKTPQYRIHFVWPLRSEDEYLKVLYIGPKITKS